jgi:hypothetical protein
MTRSFVSFVSLSTALLAAGCFDLKMPVEADAGTVTCDGGRYDPATGLCWQQPGSNQSYGWQGAIDYCDALALGGHDDWRLPSVGDFSALLGGCSIDLVSGNGGMCNSCSNSETCAALFGGNNNYGWGSYWTSTSCAFYANCVWWVDWSGGSVNHSDGMGGGYNARCVRGGDVDTGTDTGTDTGSDTGVLGMGEPCTQGGGECAAYDASFCLYDPMSPSTGICTVSGCESSGCPSSWDCWNCTTASYFYVHLCATADWSSALSAAGCSYP